MKKLRVKLEGEESGGCLIRLPFDVKAEFGKARPPLRATINGTEYRTTPAVYGGEFFLPVRQSLREAAGVEVGETVTLTIALDTEPRVVTPPPALAAALKKNKAAAKGWQAMSFTHQREWATAIADAKKPETQAKRLQQAVAAMQAKGR